MLCKNIADDLMSTFTYVLQLICIAKKSRNQDIETKKLIFYLRSKRLQQKEILKERSKIFVQKNQKILKKHKLFNKVAM